MIFHSTYLEHLKRQKRRVELGFIVIDDYESSFVEAIDKIVTKSKVPKEKIQVYCINVSVDEYDRREKRMYFFHEVEENDKEYNERIEKLKLKDLTESIQEIGRFFGCCRQKAELEILYNELVKKGKYKGVKNEVFEDWLNNESDEEKIQKSYKKGYLAGKKEADELKKKLKASLD